MMMTGIQRITASFVQKKAFVAYLTAGDGGMRKTLDAALALIDGGVTMLEIGVPFSDPIADGPVIQRAAARALARGTTMHTILELIADIRKRSDIPLILFTYMNPIYKSMQSNFLDTAQQAGVDGLLLVDCPLEEIGQILQVCERVTLAPIFVASPTTPARRVQQLDQNGAGFLYYACRKGTTGMQTQLPADFSEKMQMLQHNTRLPIVAGFGIASREAAEQVLQYADGVVVGSLFVKALEDGMAVRDLQRLARQMNPLV